MLLSCLKLRVQRTACFNACFPSGNELNFVKHAIKDGKSLLVESWLDCFTDHHLSQSNFSQTFCNNLIWLSRCDLVSILQPLDGHLLVCDLSFQYNLLANM